MRTHAKNQRQFVHLPGVADEITRRGDYLGRDEVLALLHIKPQTLYCYVSRGRIASVPHPDGRSSYYSRADVERVRSKSVARSGHGPAAASVIRWGEPVITTSVTEIVPEGPRYRQHLAVDLARSRVPFENVAEYLWSGELSSEPIVWRSAADPPGLKSFLAAGAKLHRHTHLLQLMVIAVSALGIAEGTRRERIRGGHTPMEAARRIIRMMAGTFGFIGPRRTFQALMDGQSLVDGLVANIGVKLATEQRRALNAALVLVADHELNPATFAARVAASGSADIHSCIGAALDTHYGTLVGRACDRLEQLFRIGASAAETSERARDMMDAARMLPGFNHHLYPHGDPRAQHLIELALMTGARSVMHPIMLSLRRFEDEFEARPAIECGLVVLGRALGLPDHAASGLYALGRTAGWVAHALEQRAAGFIIRPRAKFA